MNQENLENQENIHAATDPQKCFEMAKKYGWKLKGWRLTQGQILRVDCVFEGKQTSFEDERHEEQNLDRVQN